MAQQVQARLLTSDDLSPISEAYKVAEENRILKTFSLSLSPSFPLFLPPLSLTHTENKSELYCM